MKEINGSSEQDLQDHPGDRRNRLSDQHSRAQCGGRGGARRRGRNGLRGGGRRSTESGPSQRSGSQGHSGPDRRIDRKIERRQPQIGTRRKSIQQIPAVRRRSKRWWTRFGSAAKSSRGASSRSPGRRADGEGHPARRSNAEESASASEELAGQAQSLYATVEKLREIVGGQSVERSSPGSQIPAAISSNGDHSKSLASLGNSLQAPRPAQTKPCGFAPVISPRRPRTTVLTVNEDGPIPRIAAPDKKSWR